MSKKNQKSSYYVLIALLISFPITSFADLQLTPTLELSGIYTDNVTFATEGLEESDTIARVAPGIIARLRGNTTTFDLVYRLEHLMYASDSDRNSTFQQAEADLNTELVREYFFLDMDARKFQTVIDPERPVNSNVQITNNRTSVESVGISPYLQFPVFSFAQSELRYRYDKLNYDDPDITNSTIQQVNFLVRSNERSRRLFWRMDYDIQNIDYENTDNDFESEEIFLDLNYRTNPSFALVGAVGYEDFNFINVSNISDSYWNAGFVWDITRRTTLQLRTGDRFYGDTYYASLASRTRFSNWRLVYSEDITSAAQQLLPDRGTTDESVVLVDESELTGANPGNAPIGRTEPFLEKRLTFNYSYNKGGNRFLINAYTLERDYRITNEIEKEYGNEVRIDWQMLPRTILSLLGNYQNQTFEQTNNKVVSRDMGLRATAQLSENSVAYLDFSNYWSESRVDTGPRQENVVNLTLATNF